MMILICYAFHTSVLYRTCLEVSNYWKLCLRTVHCFGDHNLIQVQWIQYATLSTMFSGIVQEDEQEESKLTKQYFNSYYC